MKFTFLTGDVNWLQYGGKWASQKLNNGDWDYWLVIELINMWEATGEEDQPKYNVSLSAVSPAAAGKANVEKALGSCGLPKDIKITELMKVECLHEYGILACLVSRNGNNAHQLLHEIKKESICTEGLFGFYMDRPENRIGSAGWEMISGDPNSGLARTIASGSTQGRILAKMHGIKMENV
jgi:hypothetical protein